VRTLGVGLLGLGNVGSGLIKLLEDNRDAIAARVGADLAVRRILVREVDKPRLVDVDRSIITTDAQAVIDDPAVQILVELIGGEKPAKDYVLRAIQRGKPVVTANKLLLAHHGDAIFGAAEEKGVQVLYEASVCGGVPIIRALRDGLASDRIDRLYGIVNGTSNFILSKMTDEGRAFDEVLAQAQAEGYAEADPSLDVDGWDAAHKLCLLASLCFGVRLKPEQLLVEGLRDLAPVDIRYAERFGYVIKPLAIAQDHGDSVEARVHPTMIPRRFLLASVSGVFNAVYVSSQALGPSMYYGRGAGMMPTAVAVVSDLIDVSRDLVAATHAGLPLRLHVRGSKDRPIRPAAALRSRYYLRFGVADRPGVLAQIAGILGEHDISISELVQEGPHDGAQPQSKPVTMPVTVVVTTHQARESDVQAALAALAKLPVCLEKTRLVRILE
jgi:homoserine dehydrogenase